MHYINRCIYLQASQAHARRRRSTVLGALASSVIISLHHRRVAAPPTRTRYFDRLAVQLPDAVLHVALGVNT